MRTLSRLASTVCLLTLVGCSCSRKPEQGKTPSGDSGPLGPGVLARVGDAQLTETDLQKIVPPEVREGITGSEVRDILDRWVRSELLYQKARNDGLEKDPQVAARLHDLQRDLLADELLQRELVTRVQVGGEELQAWYRAHQAEYTQELRLQHIVVNTRDDAEEILDMLRSGASFEQIARQRSIDATASRGGDLGFLGKGAMNPAFEPFVLAAQPGTIVGPIATTFGFHVVKVVARRPAADPISFDAARDEIMHTILLEKQQDAQAKLLQELRATASVQVATTYAGMSLEPNPAAPDVPATQSFVTSGAHSPATPATQTPTNPDSLSNSRD